MPNNIFERINNSKARILIVLIIFSLLNLSSINAYANDDNQTTKKIPVVTKNIEEGQQVKLALPDAFHDFYEERNYEENKYEDNNEELTKNNPSTPTNFDEKITWESSNQNIATVNEEGEIKTLKPGNCTITATTGEINVVYDINVLLSKTSITSVVPGYYKDINKSTKPQVTLSWKPLSNASQYKIYRYSITKKAWELIYTTSQKTTKYIDRNNVTYSRYQYLVYAIPEAGDMFKSKSAASASTVTLSAPTFTYLDEYNSKKTCLKWEKSYGAPNYEIYRATSLNGTYSRITTISASSSMYLDGKSLSAGKTYYYKIRAYKSYKDADGNTVIVYSKYSSIKKVNKNKKFMRWFSPINSTNKASYKWVLSGYGWRICPFHGREFHPGLDLAASSGSSVQAVAGGKVKVAATRGYGGYGKVVIIDHGDGFYSLYAHNSSLNVKAGQQVYKGTVIAKVGSTGNSTGPHIHFEVRKGGSLYKNHVNPWSYVSKPTNVK